MKDRPIYSILIPRSILLPRIPWINTDMNYILVKEICTHMCDILFLCMGSIVSLVCKFLVKRDIQNGFCPETHQRFPKKIHIVQHNT